MTHAGAAREEGDGPPFPTGVVSTSGISHPSVSPAPADGVREKKPTGTRPASGAGALTGLLGIVCALLGIVAAPALFLPLAVAFSAISLTRSLGTLGVAGTIAATLSCALTVVGLVLYPWGVEEGPRTATTASRPAPATASQASVRPPAPAAPPENALPSKPVEESPATGSLSLPPSVVPEPAAIPATPPKKEEAGQTPPPAIPPAASEPKEKLEDALPDAPPPAAAVVVPAPAAMTPAAAADAPKAPAPPVDTMPKAPPPPADAASKAAPPPPDASKATPPADGAKVDLQPWPENRTEQTKLIQVLLRDLNFYHGTTNGTFGPGTRAAICLYLVTYDEKGECEPSKALFDSLQRRRAQSPAHGAPRR